MAKQIQTPKQKNSTPVPTDSTPVPTDSTPVQTDSKSVGGVSTPVNIQTPETPKELHYTRMETAKVKVQYTILSSRNGETDELEFGLAKVYEKQGKVKIIN